MGTRATEGPEHVIGMLRAAASAQIRLLNDVSSEAALPLAKHLKALTEELRGSLSTSLLTASGSDGSLAREESSLLSAIRTLEEEEKAWLRVESDLAGSDSAEAADLLPPATIDAMV